MNKSISKFLAHDGQDRARQPEIMWPSNPNFIRCKKTDSECLLMVYSDNAVDIFDAYKVTWLQTIPTKKVIPMDSQTSLALLTNEESKDRAQISELKAILRLNN